MLSNGLTLMSNVSKLGKQSSYGLYRVPFFDVIGGQVDSLQSIMLWILIKLKGCLSSLYSVLLKCNSETLTEHKN